MMGLLALSLAGEKSIAQSKLMHAAFTDACARLDVGE